MKGLLVEPHWWNDTDAYDMRTCVIDAFRPSWLAHATVDSHNAIICCRSDATSIAAVIRRMWSVVWLARIAELSYVCWSRQRPSHEVGHARATVRDAVSLLDNVDERVVTSAIALAKADPDEDNGRP